MIFYLEASILCYMMSAATISFARHVRSLPLVAASNVMLCVAVVLGIIFSVRFFGLAIMALEKYVGL